MKENENRLSLWEQAVFAYLRSQYLRSSVRY